MTAPLHERLAAHPYFTAHRDPVSGVTSHLLSKRVAPYQIGLYFMNPSMRGDSWWLWFRCAFPPEKSWLLCVVKLDPGDPQIRCFPNMRMTGTPWITADGETAYVPLADRVCKIDVRGEWEEVLRVPPELLKSRHLFRLVSNMSPSADGRCFLFDSHVGDEFILWLHDRETGEQKVVHRFARKMHHSHFSQHDPDLFMVSQGPGNDIYTGTRVNIETRTWLMNTGGTRLEPLTPDLFFGKNARNCHEWWTPEGKIQYCEYDSGIWEVDPESKTRELLWNRPSIHGQVHPEGTWLACDENTYQWNDRKPCSVWAWHRESGRELCVDGPLPQPPFGWKDWRAWHPDPHPHFSSDGEALIYTTTRGGTMNVAVSPTALWEAGTT